ncbi:hypothetical protein [Streptomyces sp. NPDC057889]|uniref:hypothetical protein n=1 Tax=unclassified Streptomyces TaxID=2593676 RepID=UPI0036A71871
MFEAACKEAKEQRVVFIAVEGQGPLWGRSRPMRSPPRSTPSTTVHDTVRAAVARLVRSREIRPDSFAGPVDFVLHDVGSEGRARELAAALHAALYGDLEPLTRAVPPPPDDAPAPGQRDQ